MLGTYKLALEVMQFFHDIDPWTFEEDLFKDGFDFTVEHLLKGDTAEIISQIADYELEPDDVDYPIYSKVLSDLKAFAPPERWWMDDEEVA